MDLTFRALPAWPYPEQDAEKDLFESTYTSTLDKLRREIELINGRDPLVGVVTYASHIAKRGASLLSETKVLHPGAEVSFDIPAGRGWQRVTFHTDARRTFYQHRRNFEGNLRAIALGLEALRAVNRYGITTTGQQYAGFAQLTAGPSQEQLGEELVRQFGSVNAAMRATHPDTGGDTASARDFQAVLALRQLEVLSGVNRGEISRIERGRSCATPDQAIAILAAYRDARKVAP